MPVPGIPVKHCLKKDPPHPCDSQPPCNPSAEDEAGCEEPILCLEKIKNPATGSTKCQPGPFINANTCAKPDPQHPCDELQPCSTMKPKRPCTEPTLCYHRIKNPEIPKKPIISDCDETK